MRKFLWSSILCFAHSLEELSENKTCNCTYFKKTKWKCSERLKVYIFFPEKALALVQSFSAGWKRSLEELNREILSSFPNLVTGSSLLQLALTQLVQYYHRFQKLLTPNARAQLTNIHHIKVELKKYKTNFWRYIMAAVIGKWGNSFMKSLIYLS